MAKRILAADPGNRTGLELLKWTRQQSEAHRSFFLKKVNPLKFNGVSNFSLSVRFIQPIMNALVIYRIGCYRKSITAETRREVN